MRSFSKRDFILTIRKQGRLVAQQGLEKRGATSRESRRWSYQHLQPGLHLNSCLQNCSQCQCFPQGFPDLQVPPGRPVVIQMFKGHTGAQAGVRGWGCTWAPQGALRGGIATGAVGTVGVRWGKRGTMCLRGKPATWEGFAQEKGLGCLSDARILLPQDLWHSQPFQPRRPASLPNFLPERSLLHFVGVGDPIPGHIVLSSIHLRQLAPLHPQYHLIPTPPPCW